MWWVEHLELYSQFTLIYRILICQRNILITLGIEGTAHTISCGIVDEDRILSNSSKTYHNPNGGIHPREAALHHADNVKLVIENSLKDSGLTLSQIDLVTYSRGPGLGPCLRVAATAARTISLKSGKPIIGVNHPLGHVEIGRKVTGALDPIMLYVSGGNTQVISHSEGRYRVLGETMDIGLGNLLDKLGRDLGFPFPGGPEIERLARDGRKLLDLPYSVKGMDTSFSGIYTAAKEHLRKGETPADVCFSVQEYSFAMLLEVLERGLHQTSKNEILLAGGVAKNQRLREMLTDLSEALHIKAYLTADQYCMDNGAMIAQAGMMMYKNGYRIDLEESTVDQRFRIDQVDVPWIKSSGRSIPENMGAESVIKFEDYWGRPSATKMRIPKTYRNQQLDSRIRLDRMRNEVNLLLKSHENNIPVPAVYDIDMTNYSAVYERILGKTLRNFLDGPGESELMMDKLGMYVGLMHSRGVTHGDLTAANVLVDGKGEPHLIDMSMGKADSEKEDMAVDLYLFGESINALSAEAEQLLSIFREGYRKGYREWNSVIATVSDLERRRRYV